MTSRVGQVWKVLMFSRAKDGHNSFYAIVLDDSGPTVVRCAVLYDEMGYRSPGALVGIFSVAFDDRATNTRVL